MILQGSTSIQLEQYGRVDQHGRIRGARPCTESLANGGFRRQRPLPLYLEPLDFVAFCCRVIIFLIVYYGSRIWAWGASWLRGTCPRTVLGEIAVEHICFRCFSAVMFLHALLTRSHCGGVILIIRYPPSLLFYFAGEGRGREGVLTG